MFDIISVKFIRGYRVTLSGFNFSFVSSSLSSVKD